MKGNPTTNLWSKIYQNGRMWARNSDGSISIAVGDMFVDKAQWSEVLREFAIQEGFATQKIKNEKYRHIVRCKDNKCDWRIHCSRLCDEVTWKVKSVKGKHTCAKLVHNTMASSSWVATELLALFKENPTMDYLTMQNYLMERHGIAVPTHVCQRAKKLLREWVEGKHGEAYARLPEYIEVIKEKNPGTIASCITEGPESAPIFKRLFISYEAMITGFKRGCRPLIGVDGCFLKGPYKGVLLTAMDLDPNNGYFPLAYGVVMQEDFSNWAYF